MVAPDRPGLLSKMAGVLGLHGLRAQSASVRGHAGSAVNTFVVVPRFGSPPEAGLMRQQLIAAVEGKVDVLARLDAREAESPIPTIASISEGIGALAGASASAGSTDPAVDGAGHAKFAVPALFAVAPARILWSGVETSGTGEPDRDGEPDTGGRGEGVESGRRGGGDGGQAILELRVDDRIGLLSRVSAVLESHGVDVRWAKVATLGNTVVDTFCIRRSDPELSIDDPGFRAEVEADILRVCPQPQPRVEPEAGNGPGTTGGTSRSGVPIS